MAKCGKFARLAAVAALLACSACATQPTSADVAASWEHAVVSVPGRFLATSVKDLGAEKPRPVVLLIHGCTGIQRTESAWAGFLKDEGYIVVEPNSFARSRPNSCDPRTHRAGLFPGVTMYRLDEVSYALEQLRKAPWADKRNLFLMGHSEGAVVVATANLSGFRGVIISAWVCRYGLVVPRETAVLAIDHEKDPWLSNSSYEHCSNMFGTRANARQVTLPGFDHDTFEAPAQRAVKDFLKTYSAT
jgi:dienelactone hydrolase